ncbi:alpha/beta hydrolase [Geminocystis sp. NIES-3709]|uniref:alpha/beta hydrolase n=1 Tax=Geminocystis sp. NIES-3709 TaxID=1617448 RepID=UPI0005FC39E2|nr:alpha/beta hydrolase [Geminocystis sp. NIES-3709]BAQ63490.1 esterase/lipase/thioesterase [Geminocystis sp. NIES-3709]
MSFFIILFFALIGLFLSLWIIIPAPNLFLLPFGVAVPEISPFLVIFNSLVLLLSIYLRESWYISIAISTISLILTLLPLIQIPNTIKKFDQEIELKLGEDYLKSIPKSIQEKMRSDPFIWKDILRGIPQKKIRIKRGIEFAKFGETSLKLNIYQPLLEGKYPTLIMIYGGAWRKGSPDSDERFSCYITHQGYTVITLDYRHAPKYHFPTQLEDINRGLKYIKDNASHLNIDINNIAIMGRSAGGQLAFLTAYEPQEITFKALINYYSPINLTQAYQFPAVPDPINTRKVLEDYLGGKPDEIPDKYKQASPINHIKKNLPLTLLIYPERDHIVPVKVADIISNKLTDFDNCHVLLTIPWAEHAFDAIFSGISNQIALYYTERFLAYALYSNIPQFDIKLSMKGGGRREETGDSGNN